MYRQTHGCHLICVSMHQLHTCEFKIMCSYSRPHCRTLTLAIFWADGPVAAPFLQVGVGALGVRVSLCLKLLFVWFRQCSIVLEFCRLFEGDIFRW